MFHISWWFLLTGIILYFAYFTLGLICIILSRCFDLIFKRIFKNYTEKSTKILNFLISNISSVISKFSLLYLTCILIILIPINNFIYYIELDAQIENNNFIKNKEFLKNKNYHYYKIIAPSNIWRSADFFDYYTFSDDQIEKIKELKIIKINEKLYVKPFVIMELTKEEFLKKTKDILLEKEYKNE